MATSSVTTNVPPPPRRNAGGIITSTVHVTVDKQGVPIKPHHKPPMAVVTPKVSSPAVEKGYYTESQYLALGSKAREATDAYFSKPTVTPNQAVAYTQGVGVPGIPAGSTVVVTKKNGMSKLEQLQQGDISRYNRPSGVITSQYSTNTGEVTRVKYNAPFTSGLRGAEFSAKAGEANFQTKTGEIQQITYTPNTLYSGNAPFTPQPSSKYLSFALGEIGRSRTARFLTPGVTALNEGRKATFNYDLTSWVAQESPKRLTFFNPFTGSSTKTGVPENPIAYFLDYKRDFATQERLARASEKATYSLLPQRDPFKSAYLEAFSYGYSFSGKVKEFVVTKPAETAMIAGLGAYAGARSVFFGGGMSSEGVITGSAMNAFERATYSLGLWKGVAYTNALDTVSMSALTGLGLYYGAETLGRYTSAPSALERGDIASQTVIDVASFEYGRKVSTTPVRMLFTYGVDVPAYNYFKRTVPGNKEGKFLPIETLTTRATLERGGDQSGLLFAEGRGVREKIKWTLDKTYTPKADYLAGSEMSNTGSFSLTSYRQSNKEFKVPVPGTQGDFFPYYGVRNPDLQVNIYGKSTKVTTSFYQQFHATASPMSFPTVRASAPLPLAREQSILSVAPGVSTNFLRTGLDTPYSYSLFGKMNRPLAYNPVFNKELVIGRVPSPAKMSYPYGDVLMLSSLDPLFIAQKMGKGGAEAELGVSGGKLTFGTFRDAGIITGKALPLINERPILEKTPVFKTKYIGEFGKRFGFKDYTIVDNVFVPVRQARFQGVEVTRYYAKAGSTQGQPEYFTKQEYWTEKRIIDAQKSGDKELVSISKELSPYVKESPRQITSRPTITRSFAEPLIGLRPSSTKEVSSTSSIKSFISTASSTASTLRSIGSYTASSQGSYPESITSITSTPSEISSPVSSSGRSYSSIVSTPYSPSSSSFSRSYLSSSSRSSSNTTFDITRITNIPFPNVSIEGKIRRKKKKSGEKSYFITPYSGAGNVAITSTFSRTVTSPGRERLVEFKRSRTLGQEYFGTVEQRTPRGQRLFKSFGVRL